MNIALDPTFKKILLDKIATREFAERLGVHCSDLIYCLNKQACRRLYPKPIKERELLLFSLGWSTQRWLTGADKDADAVTVDGITVTPDMIVPSPAYETTNPNFICPWELKCTFQSDQNSIDDNLHWIRQIMAQCKVTGSTTAYLSRLTIMGNWKWVYKPKAPEKLAALVEQFGPDWDAHPTLNAYRLEFSPAEIAANWDWLLARKKLFEGILENGKLLRKSDALPRDQEYECERCDYVADCTAASGS